LIPLVSAWFSSTLSNNPDFELIIAGPDDGELNNLQQLLNNQPHWNVRYIGAIYGSEKNRLLKSAHFYLLPSQSEGFPTSVLEAMQYGIIPLITEGCNFPEAFEAGVAIKIGNREEDIRKALEETTKTDAEKLKRWSSELVNFVSENYSLSIIGSMIMKTFNTDNNSSAPPGLLQ
jgi:glycosyltransferase involved in cell wall biosynthesis